MTTTTATPMTVAASAAGLARPVLLLLLLLATRCALLEASEELSDAPVGTYLGNEILTNMGCADSGQVMESPSGAFDACATNYETCFGVYSPDCDESPYTLCNRVLDGESAVSPAPDPEGCIAQVIVVTAAPTPGPTPAPTAAPQAAAAEAQAATPAPTAAPTAAASLGGQAAAAAAATPAPTESFDAINAVDCDTMTCTLPGHEPESCRHHMEDLMNGGHGNTGSMPNAGLSCEAAHTVLMQSPTCKNCFSCDLCEKNVTGNMATQRLFRDRQQQLKPTEGTAGGATGGMLGLPFRAPALAAATVLAMAGAAALVLLSIKLSRRSHTSPRREPTLREGMGYTDALAMEESPTSCVE